MKTDCVYCEKENGQRQWAAFLIARRRRPESPSWNYGRDYYITHPLLHIGATPTCIRLGESAASPV